MIITTPLEPAEVEARLRRLVRPRLTGLDWLTFWFTWDGRRPPEFTGWVSQRRFKIRRLFGAWHYGFRPVLAGKIAAGVEGTEIRFNTRPAPLGLVGPAAVIALAICGVWKSGTVGLLLFAFVLVASSALMAMAGDRHATRILKDAVLPVAGDPPPSRPGRTSRA